MLGLKACIEENKIEETNSNADKQKIADKYMEKYAKDCMKE